MSFFYIYAENHGCCYIFESFTENKTYTMNMTIFVTNVYLTIFVVLNTAAKCKLLNIC